MFVGSYNVIIGALSIIIIMIIINYLSSKKTSAGLCDCPISVHLPIRFRQPFWNRSSTCFRHSSLNCSVAHWPRVVFLLDFVRGSLCLWISQDWTLLILVRVDKYRIYRWCPSSLDARLPFWRSIGLCRPRRSSASTASCWGACRCLSEFRYGASRTSLSIGSSHTCWDGSSSRS